MHPATLAATLALLALPPGAVTFVDGTALQVLTAEARGSCRANGRSYALGTQACLSTPQGARLAQCELQQNVTSWRIGTETCTLHAALLP